MPRMTLVVTLLVALCGVTVAEVRGAPAPSLEASAAPTPTGPPSVEVLRAWDVRRAAAWGHGNPRLLRSLYTRGSEAGRHDRAMLRAWSSRGLAVHDLRTQLLAVRELRRTASTWTLLVTDRLVGGVAVGSGVRRPLPRDGLSTRIVRLQLVAGEWRVAAVRAEPPVGG
jgi:hypothetical protein